MSPETPAIVALEMRDLVGEDRGDLVGLELLQDVVR